MKKFTKKHIVIFASVTVLLASVAVFSLKSGNNAVSNAAGTVFSPVQSGAAYVLNGTKKVFSNIAMSSKNAEENKKLREEKAALESQMRMLEGYKTENEKLRKLLELKESRTEYKSTAANVIGKSTDEIHSTITIDKGTRDNIKKNAVVTVSEGLVGVVKEVGYNYSKVKTVFDSESAVSAVCLRSGDMGICESSKNATDGYCVMNYIDKSAKTVVGDLIETSGTGGIFPRGILIGKITQIKEDSRSLTLSATIETAVKINSLDTVLVSIE